MTKTDNEKYVKWGADMFIEYNPEREDEVSHTNKDGRPVPVPGDADHAGRRPRDRMVVQHRQLEGAVGKMIGEPRTPSFSQLCESIGGLDVDTDQGR